MSDMNPMPPYQQSRFEVTPGYRGDAPGTGDRYSGYAARRIPKNQRLAGRPGLARRVLRRLRGH